MGGDGGSIPGRQDLVKTKKKREEASREDQTAAKWKHCALSQIPLRSPIVACELGRLYNKEAILEKLIDPKKYPNNHASHIKRLKDVKLLNFTKRSTRDPSSSSSNDKNSTTKDDEDALFVCPIVGVEMNGIHRFVFLWTCGCVFSEKAIITLKENSCLKCGKIFKTPEDVILLNPSTDEDITRMKDLMEARRQKTKIKQKMKKKNDHDDEATTTGNGRLNGTTKRKMTSSDNDNIQNDPSRSKVFKSLFTSSEEAKKQPQGHWVTYNPFYTR